MPMTWTTRAPVLGRRGAIATSNFLASESGMNVLRRGGNCVDAVIAAAAVLNVIEPHCSHLGGDAFMLIWRATDGKLTAINSSGIAPHGVSAELFAGGISPDGFLASTVPGEVAGWDAALRLSGSMPISQLLADAIHYAEEGFPVSRDLAGALRAGADRLRQFPSSAAAFLKDGRPYGRGEVLRQPDLAATLDAIASDGPRTFYEGETGRRIAEYWQANGGCINERDLAAHRARVLEPISVTYRGWAVHEQPPVSQGHILLEALNIVETQDIAAMGVGSAELLHLCVEANKLAHADRLRFAADPAHTEFPAGLLSKGYAAERARRIDPQRAAAFPPPPGEPPMATDTTYLCCVDADGNAISYIQSVFHGFGCGVVAEGTGVLLNNRICGFSLDPTSVNYLLPGKKPVHTLNTYMVLRDGRPVIVGGTPGGDIQVQTNLQVITGLVDFGLDPQRAVEMPRWSRHEGRNVSLESRFRRATVDGLRDRGHDVTRIGPHAQGGRAQVIAIAPDGVLTAGSDPRCDGCALAY